MRGYRFILQPYTPKGQNKFPQILRDCAQKWTVTHSFKGFWMQWQALQVKRYRINKTDSDLKTYIGVEGCIDVSNGNECFEKQRKVNQIGRTEAVCRAV